MALLLDTLLNSLFLTLLLNTLGWHFFLQCDIGQSWKYISYLTILWDTSYLTIWLHISVFTHLIDTPILFDTLVKQSYLPLLLNIHPRQFCKTFLQNIFTWNPSTPPYKTFYWIIFIRHSYLDLFWHILPSWFPCKQLFLNTYFPILLDNNTSTGHIWLDTLTWQFLLKLLTDSHTWHLCGIFLSDILVINFCSTFLARHSCFYNTLTWHLLICNCGNTDHAKKNNDGATSLTQKPPLQLPI